MTAVILATAAALALILVPFVIEATVAERAHRRRRRVRERLRRRHELAMPSEYELQAEEALRSLDRVALEEAA